MTEDSLLQKAGNGIMFNLSWVAIVTSESAPIAAAVVAIHILVHQLWIGRGIPELVFIGGVSLFGLLLDQLMFSMGLFVVDGKLALAPLWLTCLWPVLATTLDHAFAGLQRHLVVASILGALGGLGSYYAGTGMTAVDFANPVAGPLIIAVAWAVLFPALALVARLWFLNNEEGEDINDAHLA